MLKKKIYLLTGFLFTLSLFTITLPSYAVEIQLNSEQIKDAIDYGTKNKNMGMAEFSAPWSVSLGKGKGFSTLFTPYLNIAYKARKFAVERRDITSREILQALEIGDSLVFSVTVYGHHFDFAKYYTAKLCQNDLTYQPVFEFTPDISDASEFWPEPPSQLARLVFKFPMVDLDLHAPVSLIIIAPGGEETTFVFDLSKMK